LKERRTPVTIWWQGSEGAPRAMAGADSPYPATVFEQVHPAMGDRVRAHAVEALGPLAGRHVWDLYAGIGETTAVLARGGASVESVESDRRAVAEAERRGPTARRHAARVEHVLGELRPPELVVTNPPRTGMDARVADAFERLRPRRVVYVSCDPATLARDLTRLPGYRLAEVRAFDLFPQTAHVETVAVLELAS
jgi:23S rRNA (uracil1939-C5)-methyltransferase